MILRTSSSREAVSCTNRMFERGSTIATPRLDRNEPWPPVVAVCPAPAPNFCCVLVGDQVEEVARLHVVELERLRDQRLEVADLGLRLELLLLLQGELLARRDQHDVAVLAHVEALGLHDDVERLVPGDVLEPQREAALDGVAGDDVEPGEVGDHLQHRPHLDVLEVERQLLALVALARALRQLVRVLQDRLDLDDEPVVGLVRRVLPQALGLDDHPRVAALVDGLDGDHRRAEVLRRRAGARGCAAGWCARKSTISDLPCWRMSMPVALSDRSTMIRPSPFLPRRKSMSRSVCCDVAGPRLGEALHRLRLGVELLALVEQRDQHGVALDRGREGLRPVEVQHHARPVAGLDHVEAAQRRVVDRALRRRRGRWRCRGSRARSARGWRSRSPRAGWRAAPSA